jgi:putative hemolysin
VQIGITLIGILTGIYMEITTDVQTFVAGFAILKPYAATIAVGLL